jgi:hypothetical protein
VLFTTALLRNSIVRDRLHISVPPVLAEESFLTDKSEFTEIEHGDTTAPLSREAEVCTEEGDPSPKRVAEKE